MYGVNGVPPTVSDAQLAALLQPYLGNLPPAPFTQNMTLTTRDYVLVFLNLIYPGIINDANSQPSKAPTPAPDFAQSLQNLLSAAQTPQTAVTGQPAPIPPNSGGLARNTASTLGSIINSLQNAFSSAGLNWPPTAPDSSGVTTAIANWGQLSDNRNLVTAALTQLNQDIPVNTVSIQLPGSTTPISVTIPLNQSLQEVLQTQYVDRGGNIIFSGLQSLYNQQLQANTSLGLLSQLQQLYNGIQALPNSQTTIQALVDPNSLKTTLENIVAQVLLPFQGSIGDGKTVYYPVAVGLDSVTISWNATSENGSVVNASGRITYSMSPDGTWSAPTITSSFNDFTGEDIVNTINGQPGGNPIINAPKTTMSLNNILTTMDSGNRQAYISDLPTILSVVFPQLGVQVEGQAVTFGNDGSLQLLLNELYQAYLQQAVQRLIHANNNPTVPLANPPAQITYDINTGNLTVDPSSPGYSQAKANLDVIQSIIDYANTLKTNSNPSGTNYLQVPGGAPTPTPFPASAATNFGTAVLGSLEANLSKILSNLVGGTTFIGGDTSMTGYLSTTQSGIDVSNWILGNWPTGLSDTPRLSGVAMDQTQSYLSNALSAASSLNDSLQQELKQSFFLFQEYVQSASSALSTINKIIVKMAQNISSR